MNSSYITSAQQAQQLPELGFPEVAFVGRSNTGKSSLLNALLGRKNLARTSNTPGRTQMVNFFAVEKADNKIIFADLPGYGFSAIGKEVRHHWHELVSAYLTRSALREVFFLIDIRRVDPLADEDRELLASLAARRPPVPVTVILTKADKLNLSDGAKAKATLGNSLKKLKIPVVKITAISTLKKRGIEELRQSILADLL